MIDEFTICLRHPGQIVGLNGRGHCAEEKKEKDRVKEETNFRLLERRLPRTFRPNRYRIVWYYKGECPDDDNVIGRIKYVRDTVASYLRMNDREIKLGDDPVKFVRDLKRCREVEVTFWKKEGGDDAISQ